jgi:hypothetical protein
VDSIDRVNPPYSSYTEELKRAATKAIGEQSSNLTEWALAVLAGMVAVVITTKVHRATASEMPYVALGPAGALLFMSLRAGWQLRGRITNATAFGNFGDVDNIALLLVSQSELFMGALACGFVFGFWYLLQIVLGRVRPYESET